MKIVRIRERTGRFAPDVFLATYVDGKKPCRTCGEYKTPDSFSRLKIFPDGLRRDCRICESVKRKQYNAANPEIVKRRRERWVKRNPEAVKFAYIKNRFGLSRKRFEAILSYQGGVCAICRKDFNGPNDTTVDHCHSSGSVRGILCRKCNVALGRVRDNPATLIAAIYYLHGPPADKVGDVA